MTFILFSIFVWVMAIFHVWDHRRFEHDVRDYIDGYRGGDWRVVNTGVLKRAFRIPARADSLRYAMPVIFLFAWLAVFHYWAPAAIYVLVIAAKWFLAETHIDTQTRSYAVVMLGRRIFGGRLD